MFSYVTVDSKAFKFKYQDVKHCLRKIFHIKTLSEHFIIIDTTQTELGKVIIVIFETKL